MSTMLTSRSQRHLPDPHRADRGGARRLLHARPRTARHRRRVRLGQIADRPRHHGPDAAAGRISANKLAFDGIDLLRLAGERRKLRGKRIAMILQDPKYSLDPVMSIGRQIVETLRTHENVGKAEARDRAIGHAGGGADPRCRPCLRSASA
jgi:hypothetical protein